MCQSPGKIPFDPVVGYHMPGWQNHDQFRLDEWTEWLDYDSSINIGMLTGRASRLVGIDIDDEPGDDMINALWHGKTWEYNTGKGRRLLFRCDDSMPRARLFDKQGRSVERLGESTNNVLPPSEHASGQLYAWTPGLTPRDIGEPAELPAWGKVSGTSDSDDLTSDEIDWVKFVLNRIVSGQRNEALTQVAGRLLGPAPLVPKEAYMLLLLINQEYSKPPLPENEIKAIVKSINRSEKKSVARRKSEVWDIANSKNVPFDQAEAIWEGMQ
jgi:hypothetical protein